MGTEPGAAHLWSLLDRKNEWIEISSQDETQGVPPQKCDGTYLFWAQMHLTAGRKDAAVKPAIMAIAGLLLLSGCDRRQDNVATGNQAERIATTPSPSAEVPPFYVGRWAPRENLCGADPWVIDERGLQAPRGVSCRFDDASQGAGPVEIAATCTAGGAPRTWRLRLSYAQSARSLLIENGPFADTGLIRCGSFGDAADGPDPSISNIAAPSR